MKTFGGGRFRIIAGRGACAGEPLGPSEAVLSSISAERCLSVVCERTGELTSIDESSLRLFEVGVWVFLDLGLAATGNCDEAEELGVLEPGRCPEAIARSLASLSRKDVDNIGPRLLRSGIL